MLFWKTKQKPAGGTGTALVATGKRGGQPALSQERRGAPTILGSDLMITGDVTADGHLLIDGRIQGGVEARLVTLGRDGEINGRIEADEVILHGLVRGSVHARRVHLVRGCRVFADIHHDVLQIDEGAYLEGAIKRLTALDPAPAVAEPMLPVFPGSEPAR
jgi:cytoskeletal protein CcmA (bactofilin family)